jgi:RNA polymerase sigma-70 factor (ECF subfamily)
MSQTSAEEVFHAYAGRVYSLARRMLGNDADAEDAALGVLLQLVCKLPSLRGEAEISPWLHRATVNAVLARRRGPERPLDHVAATQPDSLEAAIAQLPEMYRDVFVLADVEELPNAEIGQLLGLSLPAVKSRLHRARLMVRDSLAPYLPTP